MDEFLLRSNPDKQPLIDAILSMDITRPKRVKFIEVKSKRSDAQNSLLWMWNNLIQKHLAEHYGQFASATEWHEILVSRLCPAELHRVNLPDGTSYKVGRSKTSKFSTKEMTDYLEVLDAYCAEHLKLILPRPEDLMNAIYGERRPNA